MQFFFAKPDGTCANPECTNFFCPRCELASFTIALGKHNSGLIRRKLEETDGLYVKTYTIKSAIKMSDRATSCMDVQDIDEIIVNMVFFRYHGMYFLDEKISVDKLSSCTT